MQLRRPIALLCLICLLVCLGGCKTTVKADISAYADSPVEIAGLTDEEFTITPAELAEMDCVKAIAQGQTEKAGTVTGIGPTLETFLAQYGRTIDEFKKVRFFCADDYKVVLKTDYLTEYDIVLTVCKGKEPLPEEHMPLRIIIPEAESGKWCYGVIRIEFVEA